MEYEFEYSSQESDLPVWAWVLYGAIIFFILAAHWRIFTKAGQPGWAAFIPILNIYGMTKVVGKPGYWTLLFFVPIVNIIIAIWLVNLVSKSFGKDEGFTLGLILLPFIFWPILGFGPAKYLGPYGDPAAFATYQGKQNFEFEQNQQ